MDEILAPDELERAVKLIADLEGLRGSSCKSCNAAVCHHEALFSISMGFKNMPLCCSCLAAEFDRNPTQLRDELWSSLMRRPCHRVGWAWANREEKFEPGDLPLCLWPDPVRTAEPGHAIESSTGSSELSENAAWDAGDMSCGDLVLELRVRLRQMKPREVLHVTATDPGAREDIPAWCRLTGHALVGMEHPEYWIQRKEN